MKFVYISPEFPKSNWQFCDRLKRNGVTVLGIGQERYENLDQTLREALTEYYKVNNLEDYDEMLRAVAFFTFKYGKLDFLESNNEYWLEKDARLRTDFNIPHGFHVSNIEPVKSKSLMKEYFAKAGVPCARGEVVTTLDNALAFANKVGYPLVVKPDKGVGAAKTYKLSSPPDVEKWFLQKDGDTYLLEEYLDGEVVTYDAIINSRGEPIFDISLECPVSIMTMVNDGVDCVFYSCPEPIPELKPLGLKVVEAFGIKSRFVHLEFFRLNRDHPGLAPKGAYLALEVNMRPAGGFSPDMYNYARSEDVFQIWADMVAFDKTASVPQGPSNYCISASRHDEYRYVRTHQEIMDTYRDRLALCTRMPDVEARVMGNTVYLAKVATKEEIDEFVNFVTQQSPAT